MKLVFLFLALFVAVICAEEQSREKRWLIRVSRIILCWDGPGSVWMRFGPFSLALIINPKRSRYITFSSEINLINIEICLSHHFVQIFVRRKCHTGNSKIDSIYRICVSIYVTNYGEYKVDN